ncbi:PREDICTED: nucleolin 2-like [Erythranthe guttata]|uniref:nucleolin 2-like n=1 Tax=Erythranthe guttata TaxID=4155 RepID=UPI00064DC5EC|nr:PREDICTED: nucleolin 2-like [Erythranthe guttata]|eukprot:XP_012837870.1 PREDICTED: nucleolin 2-like [Erythranthe guttata]
MNPFSDLNTARSQRRRGGNSPRRGGIGGRRGNRGGRTPVRPNPLRGLHLVDEDTDDEAGDPYFAEPEAQALSSSSTESSSNDSPLPASTQGETSQPNMAAAASQHSVSEDATTHVPEDAAAHSDSANAPQSAAEDAAPYQDEEIPSAPHPDPLETLAEATVQVDASPSQTEEEETNDDSWEVPFASFRKNLPSSESDSDSSKDSSQMEEDAAPPVASPEPAYILDELEDSEEEESSEEEEPDLDGKDLSTHFELTHPLAQITYHQSMVEMLQKVLSDQKGGEQASHEVEAGTSHPLDEGEAE